MYTLEEVTNKPDLWSSDDPVRPELSIEFKTAPGRKVFGLKNEKDKNYEAFMCCAFTEKVPSSVDELTLFTKDAGKIAIPYTVWSKKRGAGRKIIQMVLEFAKSINIERVVTLSPLTEMARKFHLKNNAFEFRANENTVNFEYTL